MTKMFPLQDEHVAGRPHDTLALVTSVPWGLVEPLRARCMKVHDQTLEVLASRGGLAIAEFWCHVHTPEPFSIGAWFRLETPTPDAIRTWIRGLLQC